MNHSGQSAMLPNEIRLIRLPAVCELTGLSRASVYSYISSGMFTRPASLGGRAVAWVHSEVQEWIAGRIAARK